MPCVVPFNNKSLDITFFALRPVGVFADELICAMKCFSFHAEYLGCVHSSIFKSIHGNLIIWYGAWIKRSKENKEILNATLLSALTQVSNLAIILDHGFFDVYVGESIDGHTAAKFSSGDTIAMGSMIPISGDSNDLLYACSAIHKSSFRKMNGVSDSIYFRCLDKPMVAIMQVWKSLDACYSWFLNSDYRRTIKPFFAPLSEDIHYDIFKVIYVSSDEAGILSSLRTIEGEDGNDKGRRD